MIKSTVRNNKIKKIITSVCSPGASDHQISFVCTRWYTIPVSFLAFWWSIRWKLTRHFMRCLFIFHRETGFQETGSTYTYFLKNRASASYPNKIHKISISHAGSRSLNTFSIVSSKTVLLSQQRRRDLHKFFVFGPRSLLKDARFTWWDNGKESLACHRSDGGRDGTSVLDIERISTDVFGGVWVSE